jgi:Bacterial extracellular solute-binding proteins, family 3
VSYIVIPAKAGIQRRSDQRHWVPAFAGTTHIPSFPRKRESSVVAPVVSCNERHWVPAFAGTTAMRLWACRRLMSGLASVTLVFGCGAAVAQTPEGQLAGTLQKAHASGTVAIGYREASIPLSYLSTRNEPIGYSIDLCRAIVDAMSTEVGRDLVIKFVPVTSDNRMNAVAGGQVDLECGSTTSNLERKKVVDFSQVIFIAGTKLMVKQGSPIK